MGRGSVFCEDYVDPSGQFDCDKSVLMIKQLVNSYFASNIAEAKWIINRLGYSV